MRSILALLLLLVANPASAQSSREGTPARPARAAGPPRFEPGACDSVPDVADVLPRLRCGTVQVPQNHANPDGAAYTLAVVVVRSERQPPRPDPVV